MARVLVVEDEVTLLKNIVRSLRQEGLEVLTARDCEGVRQALVGGEIDILCLDLHLPDGNGLDLIEDTRARNPSVGAIVMSGHVTDAQRARAMRLGITEMLEKPFGLRDLKDLLAQQLEAIGRGGAGSTSPGRR